MLSRPLTSEDETPAPPRAEGHGGPGASPTSVSSSHSPSALNSFCQHSSASPPLSCHSFSPRDVPLFCPSVTPSFLAPPAPFSRSPSVTPLLYPISSFPAPSPPNISPLPHPVISHPSFPLIVSPLPPPPPASSLCPANILPSTHTCLPSRSSNIRPPLPNMSHPCPPSLPPPPILFSPPHPCPSSPPPTMSPPPPSLPQPNCSPPPPSPPPSCPSSPPPSISPPSMSPPPPSMSPPSSPPLSMSPPSMSPPPPCPSSPPLSMSPPLPCPPSPPSMSPPRTMYPLPSCPPLPMSPSPPPNTSPSPTMSPPCPSLTMSPLTVFPSLPTIVSPLPMCLPPSDISPPPPRNTGTFPTVSATTAMSPPPSPLSPRAAPSPSLLPSLSPPLVTLSPAVFLPPPPDAPLSDSTVFRFSHPSALTHPSPAPPVPPSHPHLMPTPPLAHIPSPCCSCSALLPRLLSAHRMEVRRLLRGALSSLNRRLDALERRCRMREEDHLLTPQPDVITATSGSVSSGPRRPQTFDQTKFGKRRKGEEHERRDRKRRRRVSDAPSRLDEEESRRFVGRMAVILPAEGVGERLKLQDFQLTKTSVSSSQNALHCLDLVHGRLHSGRFAASFSSNHVTVSRVLATSSFGSAPMWRLSAAAVEALMSVRGGACGHPERPLKDWTAPPSLSSDHSYVLQDLSSVTPTRRPQKLRTNQIARRRPLALPAPVLVSQSAACSEFADVKVERRKQVSQFRIRRSSPRETHLTPMGLPKMKRLTKKNFSLEEIYTNKNFNHSAPCRSLETIFEEPREKDGTLLLIGQQRRRRVLLFPDFTLPRKRRRTSGTGLILGSAPRKRAAARRHVCSAVDSVDLDVMLVERLSALEDFLLRHGLS